MVPRLGTCYGGRLIITLLLVAPIAESESRYHIGGRSEVPDFLAPPPQTRSDSVRHSCARHGVEFRRNSRRRAIYTFILLYLTAELWPVQ